MSYTTKQRHEIYKKALSLLPLEGFLCHAMQKATGVTSGQWYFLENFPEFKMFAPNGEYRFVWNLTERPGASVYDEDNKLPRQIILDFCILMTENETSC